MAASTTPAPLPAGVTAQAEPYGTYVDIGSGFQGGFSLAQLDAMAQQDLAANNTAAGGTTNAAMQTYGAAKGWPGGSLGGAVGGAITGINPGGLPRGGTGPLAGAGAGGNPNGSQTSGPEGDAFAQIQALLLQYGLQSLSAWAWQQITSGQTPAEIIISMYQQPAFQARFPAITAMQNAGLAVPTPAEYLQTENAYKAVLTQFGMPVSSNPSDYVNLFVNQVSANEFQQRSALYDKIVNVYGPRLTQGFETYAGIKGVTNDQLYGMMSGMDGGTLAQQYVQNGGSLGSMSHLAGNGNVAFSWQAIQDLEQKAENAQKAEFMGGGSVATGPTPATEEQTIRARTGLNYTTTPVNSTTPKATGSI